MKRFAVVTTLLILATVQPGLVTGVDFIQRNRAHVVGVSETTPMTTSSMSSWSTPSTTNDANTQMQQKLHHRNLSSSNSDYSDIGWFWLALNYLGMHLGPCHISSDKSSHCPHPPHPPHHHSSSSSSSGGSSSSSSGGSSSSSGGGGGSSSSSSSLYFCYYSCDNVSDANCVVCADVCTADCSAVEGYCYSCDDVPECADACDDGAENCVVCTDGWSPDGWSNDGWESSNLDNGSAGSAGANSSVGMTAKSIVPFIIGALVAAAIGAMFVVALKRRRQMQDGNHPLEGSLKKRMRMFAGSLRRKGGEPLNPDENAPEFIEISSVKQPPPVGSAAPMSAARNINYNAPPTSQQPAISAARSSSYNAPIQPVRSNLARIDSYDSSV